LAKAKELLDEEEIVGELLATPRSQSSTRLHWRNDQELRVPGGPEDRQQQYRPHGANG
jgi:hypothetical protein